MVAAHPWPRLLSSPQSQVTTSGIYIVFECDDLLGEKRSCYLKNGRILCRDDYVKMIKELVKCCKCHRTIAATDWVRRAGPNNVYHLACFACDLCHRQLSTGEQFTIDHDVDGDQASKLLCRLHFGITKDGECGDSSSNEEGSSTGSTTVKTGKTKRVRTTFTEEQLQILQANFQIDSNPDGQDLERIAALTGLSKRVTQVWFQNSRARQKKYMNKNRTSHHSSSPGSWSPDVAAMG
ncbi:LIM/homeobox protein Awh [Halotydeus destructor]|nr:LIM/homeobox protein Awh [Halotydeus destructor]